MTAYKKQSWTPLCPPEKITEAKTNSLNKDAENHLQKAEIDRLKKLLSEKIKDPKLAQKAAMLISEMINNKK